MKFNRLVLALVAIAGVAPVPAIHAQTLDPHTLTLFHRPPKVWPTYNGDYSGRRFSALKQINQGTLGQLKL
ncbi:MAG: acido-empty-quinoprotein group A, partial [Bryobacteraceae bacterium]